MEFRDEQELDYGQGRLAQEERERGAGQRQLLQADTAAEDSSGRPMKNYDEIDIAKWIEEVNQKENR